MLVGVRFFWVFVATYLPRLLIPGLARRDPPPPWQHVFVVAFTGIRGVVSLAAALSIPLMADGEPFPARGLLLLVDLRGDPGDPGGPGTDPALGDQASWAFPSMAGARPMSEKRREITARLASIDAALARLDTLEGGRLGAGDGERRSGGATRTAAPILSPPARIWSMAMSPTPAPRCNCSFWKPNASSIAELYYQGEISDEARRRIERELDLEDSRIRHSAESGAARAL